MGIDKDIKKTIEKEEIKEFQTEKKPINIKEFVLKHKREALIISEFFDKHFFID